jgi:protein SCO1
MRWLLYAVVAAFVLTGCGAKHEAAPAASKGTPAGGGFAIDPPTPAPSFLLADQDGKPTGPQQYRGKWTAVTFLYTHCPDVCPLIADQLAAAERRDASLRVIAVSVDPARDTRAAVRQFLARHHTGPHFRFVIGSRKALSRVWHAYHIAALPGPSGTISHSAFTLLVDPQGRERVLFDSHVTARSVLSSIHSIE